MLKSVQTFLSTTFPFSLGSFGFLWVLFVLFMCFCFVLFFCYFRVFVLFWVFFGQKKKKGWIEVREGARVYGYKAGEKVNSSL